MRIYKQKSLPLGDRLPRYGGRWRKAPKGEQWLRVSADGGRGLSGFTSLLNRLFWFFPFQIHHKAQAEEQLDDGGQRRRKTNMEQRGVGGAADEVGHRHTHAEGTCDALQHDKPRLADAVVVACVAEEDGGKQAVNGVGTQVIRRSGDDFRVRGEDARQQVAVEVGEEEHPYADDEGHRRAVVQRLAGAVHAAGTVVLGHKGRDRLHEGRGDFGLSGT